MMYKMSIALSLATAAVAVKTDAKKAAKNACKVGALGLATLASKANAFGDLPECQASGWWNDDYDLLDCQYNADYGTCDRYGYDEYATYLSGYEACEECGECVVDQEDEGCRAIGEWWTEDADLNYFTCGDVGVVDGLCDYTGYDADYNWFYASEACEACGECSNDGPQETQACAYANELQPWQSDLGYSCYEFPDYGDCGDSGVIVLENYDEYIGYYDDYNYYTGYEACSECGVCSDDRRKLRTKNVSEKQQKDFLKFQERKLKASPNFNAEKYAEMKAKRQLTPEQIEAFKARQADKKTKKN